MPSTPNRGYTYPADGDPATVPADMASPLAQIDADVQTLVDESAAKVGLNADGTAPPVLEGQIRDLISTEAPPPDLSAYPTTAEAEVMVDDKIDAAFAEADDTIPIFPTLAEAQAWEVANPGRVALTIEDQSPDTVPPSPGTLSVSPEGTYANALVTGATDDRGTLFYSFRLGTGAWSGWQSEPSYRFEGLTVLTSYTASHRVRDIGSNVVSGASVPFETLAVDRWGTLWADSMGTKADGSLTGKALDTAPAGTVWQEGATWYSTGNNFAPAPGVPVESGVAVRPDTAINQQDGPASFVTLPSSPSRVLISLTSVGNQAGSMPGVIVGGVDDVNWTMLRTTGNPTGYRIYAASLWRGSYSAHEANAIDTVVEQGSGGTDGWNLRTFTYDIDTATRVVDFRQDGDLKMKFTIPESLWSGGRRYGVHFSNFAYAGWMTDFSIRWE